ncbi:MAG: hypothetical protein ACK2UO_13835 [Caldilineaceae bacterium]
MRGKEQIAVRIGFWAVILFSVFAWAPTTYPGYWEAIEGFRPVFNAVHPTAIAGVATQADLWRGSGSATYLIAQPLMLFGMSPTAAVRATFAVAFILGGLGMYVWLRERWGDRGAGLAGMLFMLWPPLLATVYVRGSLSDALLLGLMPLAFAGIAINSKYHNPSSLAIIAISVFWIWRTQAGLAGVATVLLLAYAFVVERSWLTLLVVLFSAAAGLTSLIPFWSIRAESPVAFFDQFIYPQQLLYGTWTVAPSVAGWQDKYPFLLGVATVGFGIVALWLWVTQRGALRGTRAHSLLAFSSVGALLLILVSLPVTSPMWQISHADRLFTYPWQPLLLAGPLLAVIASSLVVTSTDLAKPVLWTVLLALVVLGSLPYLTAEFTQIEAPESPRAVFGLGPDIVLLGANVNEDEDRQQARLAVTWQTAQPLPFDYNVFFQALRDTPDGVEVVAQLDAQPLQGERPATSWIPGEIFTDTYTLDLSADSALPAGGQDVRGTDLRYYFGYYDWRDGSRLPVDGGIDDKLVLHGE